ncbi:MAG TPA: phosphoenolpyruvate carboxylase [Steroidobacteraceae bacterium]|jgi:phosphoenolpyruvate carboxylase|nr:phosphoenolpyruvate carboxylase [Steroidobacteraceae bacterium]
MNRSEILFPPQHAALREDVHALGALVGEILREQGGAALLDLVEADRILAIHRRDGDPQAGIELAARVQGRPPAAARDLVRAFSAWFQVVNIAEKVHRIRRRRQYFLKESARPQPGGVEDALGALKERGASFDEVFALIGSLRIEPVFMAHPTESTRRTMLRKRQRITQLLLDRLDPTLAPNEMRSIAGRLRTELTSAWQTEDHPREKLTVSDEREHVLFYLVEILYRVVPAFYDEIGQALEKLYGVAADSLELPTILRFGSWVGGDMDGNPDVHAKSIRETLARQQQMIVNAYYEECQTLVQQLSQSASRISVSPALAARIDDYMTLLPSARTSVSSRHDRMPYRVFLAQIGERLRHTYAGRANGYEQPRQFRADVQLIADSLNANKGAHAGLFFVRRLLRRIDTFGFHIATLDVRQHTGVHHQMVARGLDDPHWRARPREERRQLLGAALEGDVGPRAELDAFGKRSLSVFDAVMQGRHRYGADSVGYFIVSGASGADDVLAALLLARWAEAYDKRTGEVALDFAPMFESIESLEHCGETMRELLDDPRYRRHLEARGRKQCVLIGYSDTNKEAGLCASRFAIHEAQRSLAQVLTADHESHVIFHGRGGSIARGGGRIDALVRSAPAEAVNGVLRLTEQGEVVQQNYGLRPIAMRTLERAFNALSMCTFAARNATLASDDPQQLQCAATIAVESRSAYRRLVHGEPAFYDYFRFVTPIDVIERMQIAARPVYRAGVEALGALRAVPWVFAWTQARHMLPGWYGAGAGLHAAIERFGLATLRAGYANWYFLHNLIDDIEAMLARADLEIAQAYNILAPTPLHRFFADIRLEFAAAREHVLQVKDCAALLDTDPTLQRSLQLRNPYVDPMNLMQVDLLRRWRASERADRDLFEALLASIGGIAQGLQSTG